jgi:hypothetical protein
MRQIDAQAPGNLSATVILRLKKQRPWDMLFSPTPGKRVGRRGFNNPPKNRVGNSRSFSEREC